MIKKREDLVTGDDIREGLTAIISIMLAEPQCEEPASSAAPEDRTRAAPTASPRVPAGPRRMAPDRGARRRPALEESAP
ncbi:hypothetical protein [Luteococcus peritonei]|uniref:Uncharacterized protein n=1 Tax=Luteococcus peritonei TaxID=88874 RepID=A0ABW4RSR1_9ACTN